MHAWVQGMEHHPAFHWARANGWAIMAMAELLEVLPENHPQRARILALFRAHAAGLIANQGHAGLWHQLLDRRESYEETSASAMFVFAIARGINRGWLDPPAFGPAVSLGWNAVATKVNAKGQVEGTCVGTGVGWDPMFYMYRPVHLLAAHGYGPVLLAGAEMIELRRKHPDIGIHDGGVQFGKRSRTRSVTARAGRARAARAPSPAPVAAPAFRRSSDSWSRLCRSRSSLFCGSENTTVSTVNDVDVHVRSLVTQDRSSRLRSSHPSNRRTCRWTQWCWWARCGD